MDKNGSKNFGILTVSLNRGFFSLLLQQCIESFFDQQRCAVLTDGLNSSEILCVDKLYAR